MSGVIRVKRNGSWAPARGLYVKQSGSWTPAEAAYIKQAGTWVQIYPADSAIFGASPSSLDFTTYKDFSSTSQRLTINNSGTDTLTINSISISQVSQFTAQLDYAGMGNTTSAISIAPGQSKYVDVTVTGHTEGSYTSYINFDYSIGVLGTQTSRVAVNTTVDPQYATVAISPSAVSYSTYFTGPVPSKIIRITNNGNGGVLTINSITSASGLTTIAIPSFTVPSGRSTEFIITAPTGRSAGTHGDTIYVNTSAGNETIPVTFTVDALSTGANDYTTPGTYTWTVPTGITSAEVTIVGAGGGGGGSTEVGYGGGGGGGGSGGLIERSITLTPGEVVSITVGAGGAGAPFVGRTRYPPGGSAGSSSIISALSGTFTATAGSGGAGAASSGDYSPTTGGGGGSGGTPRGYSGIAGEGGTNDRSSTSGGNGAFSFVSGSVQGFGGTPSSPTGKNGTRGSGGGGAGAPDRTNPLNWAGGRGGDGYVRITW